MILCLLGGEGGGEVNRLWVKANNGETEDRERERYRELSDTFSRSLSLCDLALCPLFRRFLLMEFIFRIK